MTTHLKSPLAWLGGKSRLADRIIDRIPPHTAYCEVFAGAAWVLFKKPESKVEIINDINRELITLYRCVKHHLPALVEQFRWMLVARDEFDRFLKTPADTLTDIQRSARFYYLAKAAFGARVNKLDIGMTLAANQAVHIIAEHARQNPGAEIDIVLIRYKTDDDLHRYRADIQGLPATAHAAIIYRTRATLADADIPSRIIYMQPEVYSAWLGKRKDTEATRSEWAATQIAG